MIKQQVIINEATTSRVAINATVKINNLLMIFEDKNFKNVHQMVQI